MIGLNKLNLNKPLINLSSQETKDSQEYPKETQETKNSHDYPKESTQAIQGTGSKDLDHELPSKSSF